MWEPAQDARLQAASQTNVGGLRGFERTRLLLALRCGRFASTRASGLCFQASNGAHFLSQGPGSAIVQRYHVYPAETVRRSFSEDPPSRFDTLRSLQNHVVIHLTSNEWNDHAVHRAVPSRPPCVDLRVVEADRHPMRRQATTRLRSTVAVRRPQAPCDIACRCCERELST